MTSLHSCGTDAESKGKTKLWKHFSTLREKQLTPVLSEVSSRLMAETSSGNGREKKETEGLKERERSPSSGWCTVPRRGRFPCRPQGQDSSLSFMLLVKDSEGPRDGEEFQFFFLFWAQKGVH